MTYSSTPPNARRTFRKDYITKNDTWQVQDDDELTPREKQSLKLDAARKEKCIEENRKHLAAYAAETNPYIKILNIGDNK